MDSFRKHTPVGAGGAKCPCCFIDTKPRLRRTARAVLKRELLEEVLEATPPDEEIEILRNAHEYWSHQGTDEEAQESNVKTAMEMAQNCADELLTDFGVTLTDEELSWHKDPGY